MWAARTYRMSGGDGRVGLLARLQDGLSARP